MRTIESVQDARLDAALRVLERGETPPDLTDAILARATDERRRSSLRSVLSLVAGLAIVFTVWICSRPSEPSSFAIAQDPVPHHVEVSSVEDVVRLPRSCTSVIGVDLNIDALTALDRLDGLQRLELRAAPQEHGPDLERERLPVGSFEHVVKHADLSELVIMGYGDLSAPQLAALRALPKLHTLEFVDEAPSDEVLAAATQLPQIRRLRIDGARHMSTTTLVQIPRMPLLRSLEIIDPAPDIPADAWCALGDLGMLESLTISGGSPRTLRRADFLEGREFGLSPAQIDDSVVACFAGLPSLRRLSLGNLDDVSDEGLASLRTSELRALELHSCTALTDACFTRLPKQLESLSIVGCQQLGEALPEGLTLREFELCATGHATDTTLRSIASWKQLHALRLSVLPSLTRAAIDSLATMTRLEVLELEGTGWLSDDDAERLAALENLRELSVRGYNHTSFLAGFHGKYYGGNTAVTGIGLAEFSGCRRLARIDAAFIGQVHVRDLRALRSLPLTELRLKGTDVVFDETTPDWRALRRLWPNCRVDASRESGVDGARRFR